MRKFYIKSFLFWFVLLAAAFINAAIRETTYKPLLVPHIGMWAHQISSITGIIFFFVAIYYFLKHAKEPHTKRDLFTVGLLWIVMTIIFESFMNISVRHLSFKQITQTYYFWKGDAWSLVLLSLAVSPLIANRILQKKFSR